ncbi:glycoside hydrolase family 16 protein [Irpex rosettiformis]|uniref:Glycoside hydrolase family 16 protein n=1 Tax=Irpex rosettiformis TaxID=378272 RepID=A0ACB8TRJ5_9APHY|nr:glycoside hydrolase family 16 protein [Irpex rosettiformis]
MVNSTANSTFVWVIEDTYQGKTFFDTFDFFAYLDPTHGKVNYTTREDAFSQRLAYVDDNGTVIMKGDDTTQLTQGINRNSVRISSQKIYNTGLFILDLNRVPWGCGVWPAWWTVTNEPSGWPWLGEVDIIEGVHDNEHNQVAWHTGPNCTLTPPPVANFTGTYIQNQTTGQPNLCDGNIPGNSGCAILEASRASYGPTFDAAGGGVFAMKWDDTGISVWSFYRALVPTDIQSGEPKPENWGTPVAFLDPSGCNPIANFINHTIVFDITFCGDWAGNSYATSGCPGTCEERLMDPANFVNASWSINYMKVYKRVSLVQASNSAPARHVTIPFVQGLSGMWIATLIVAVLGIMLHI